MALRFQLFFFLLRSTFAETEIFQRKIQNALERKKNGEIFDLILTQKGPIRLMSECRQLLVIIGWMTG